ncbi:MAG: cell division protein ZapA [Bacteroidaceae bacterium]|nr:cell division protein ZapA [Bacteroidaceae bacterium]MDE6158769.1 cell division protein ZapA [Bacteroidaceae bacterium]
MTTSDRLNITLKIGTRQFPMTVAREDEYAYREAEKLINERLRFYADRYPTQGTETYLMMALLDIALKLKQSELMQDSSSLATTLQSMLNDLEKVVSTD